MPARVVKALILHSQYATGSSSGENRVVADDAKLLAEAGHDVETWTPLYDAPRGAARGAAEAVWSRRARIQVERRISGGMPDVVHVHNVFPVLSPAVLRSGLPTVMTLHNYRLACLSATFIRDGRICEDCLGRSPLRGVIHSCYRNSYSASAVLAASIGLHRAVGSFRRVTLFAAVSDFVRQKLAEGGLDPRNVRVRRNFSWPAERRIGPGSYFLALGRLSPEKGLDRLVANWVSRFPLIVVGDGPERQRLQACAAEGVEFWGAMPAARTPDVLRNARAILVPSIGYETAGRSMIEAFAAGVPAIASRIGGIPEYLEHGVSGLLVDPLHTDAWRAAVGTLEDDATTERLGEGAYRSWHERFSPEISLRSIEAIYNEAITISPGRP